MGRPRSLALHHLATVTCDLYVLLAGDDAYGGGAVRSRDSRGANFILFRIEGEAEHCQSFADLAPHRRTVLADASSEDKHVEPAENYGVCGNRFCDGQAE